jgi:hypothetical protein
MTVRRELAPLLGEHDRRRLQCGSDTFDGRGRRVRPANALTEQIREDVLTGEEDFAFVGEMPKETALRQPGSISDLGN